MQAAHALIVALLISTIARPAAAALPLGTPDLAEMEAAMYAPLPAEESPGAGLTPLRDDTGNVVALEAESGAYAEASLMPLGTRS